MVREQKLTINEKIFVGHLLKELFTSQQKIILRDVHCADCKKTLPDQPVGQFFSPKVSTVSPLSPFLLGKTLGENSREGEL